MWQPSSEGMWIKDTQCSRDIWQQMDQYRTKWSINKEYALSCIFLVIEWLFTIIRFMLCDIVSFASKCRHLSGTVLNYMTCPLPTPTARSIWCPAYPLISQTHFKHPVILHTFLTSQNGLSMCVEFNIPIYACWFSFLKSMYPPCNSS